MNRINFMQSTNFEFLRLHNPLLADMGGLAEAVLYIDPGSALTRMRAFAEEVVKSVYKEERLPRVPQAGMHEMIKASVFTYCVDRSLINNINYVRVEGNQTAHGATGELRNARMSLNIAHQLGMYLGLKYYGLKKADIPAFKDIADSRNELSALQKSVETYQRELEEKTRQLNTHLEQVDQSRQKTFANEPEPTDVVKAHKREQSQRVANALEWNEAKTRKLLIDVMLRQAGWDTGNPDQVSVEYEVQFQETPSGKGRVDYVLWGDNGQPLAVIEAKKPAQSEQNGREQARSYATSLEKMGYQRPVVFYTNGYETFIWDDTHYNTCRVIYGFYSKDSLDYLIYQRNYREAELERFNPNPAIADRPYQIEAVKSVAKRFQDQRRKALIVQATGTGKTRVAIAIAELLLRTGWGKRVLFLCDRKELRTQADEAFKKYLPGETRCVIGETNRIDTTARIYIATYPGIMNRFAQLDVGFFDLIIADESHRSIYNKYRDLFDYFDALQLGLTATPVKFIARDTFDIFDCEKTDPTFAYGLEAAINNEPPYLCSFRAKDLTTDFLRDGIHYNDLDDSQKQRLEEDLGEDIARQTTIAGKDIGRKIFSEGTDRIILENLMQNGIKDETGSLVGKTIVFAQRQDHAEHLEKLFCKLYPQYGTRVCKVIHGNIPRAEELIKEFKQEGGDFRIAISVDMLDTGIDVPEVVNLVFAKPVKSYVKFWQMIGRGTRLCLNLFGSGKHKTEFLIFDHYGNFEFFEQEYKEADSGTGKSLLQNLFEARIDLAESALKLGHRDAFDTALALIAADINDLPDTSIPVKRELRTVHQLQQTGQLQKMDANVLHALRDKIAPLMGVRVLKDKHATQLDKRIADIEKCFVEQAACLEDGRDKLLAELDALAINIQAVRQKDTVIAEVRSAEFWQNLSIERLEQVRQALRGIMKYRQQAAGVGQATPTTGTSDGGIQEIERTVSLSSEAEAALYRRKVKTVLDEMVATNPVLQKIREGQPVQPGELSTLTSTILTSHPGVKLDVLNEFYARTADQLDVTIRELIGMDPTVVEQHFIQFLQNHPELTHLQVRFFNLLKNYLAQHGTITVEKLYEAPFTSLSHEGIDGVFSHADVNTLVSALQPFLPPEAN